ncbi:hypothetical protein HZ326_16750 [Fusarium oxysporum f. sp. albedinis]|nr:hypothetical protein HZ326_16750 [Fusarium oxysporum f. sp. albedinis]
MRHSAKRSTRILRVKKTIRRREHVLHCEIRFMTAHPAQVEKSVSVFPQTRRPSILPRTFSQSAAVVRSRLINPTNHADLHEPYCIELVMHCRDVNDIDWAGCKL